jgi:hypothetical protein
MVLRSRAAQAGVNLPAGAPAPAGGTASASEAHSRLHRLENPIIAFLLVNGCGRVIRLGAQIPDIGPHRPDWSDNRTDGSEPKAGNISSSAVNLLRPWSDQ